MDENPNAGRDYFGNYPRIVGGDASNPNKENPAMNDDIIIGDIVMYQITKEQEIQIQKRRDDARQSQVAATNSGVVVHVGNPSRGGSYCPAVVTHVFKNEFSDKPGYNLHVLLDGNDALWVTSVPEGSGPGQLLKRHDWYDLHGDR